MNCSYENHDPENNDLLVRIPVHDTSDEGSKKYENQLYRKKPQYFFKKSYLANKQII